MREISPRWCPRVAERIVDEVVGDELILYDPASDQVHVLNTFAAAIFDFCDGETPVSSIVSELERAIPSASFALSEETYRLVASLVEKKILE